MVAPIMLYLFLSNPPFLEVLSSCFRMSARMFATYFFAMYAKLGSFIPLGRFGASSILVPKATYVALLGLFAHSLPFDTSSAPGLWR